MKITHNKSFFIWFTIESELNKKLYKSLPDIIWEDKIIKVLQIEVSDKIIYMEVVALKDFNNSEKNYYE